MLFGVSAQPRATLAPRTEQCRDAPANINIIISLVAGTVISAEDGFSPVITNGGFFSFQVAHKYYKYYKLKSIVNFFLFNHLSIYLCMFELVVSFIISLTLLH